MEWCLSFAKSVSFAIAKLAILAIFSLAVACVGPNSSIYPPRASESARTVFVINHSVLHTGVVVRRSDIPRGLWPANCDYSGFKYLEVG